MGQGIDPRGDLLRAWRGFFWTVGIIVAFVGAIAGAIYAVQRVAFR